MGKLIIVAANPTAIKLSGNRENFEQNELVSIHNYRKVLYLLV